MGPATSRAFEQVKRRNDIQAAPQTQPASLPPVDWQRIGNQAPLVLSVSPRQQSDPLPRAEIVIITWTTSEWQALDHVFLGSSQPEPSDSTDWQKKWLPYTRNAANHSGGTAGGQLWGAFQLVQITDNASRPWRVLLFKSNAHLAHPPFAAGLTDMMANILADTQALRVYSIGTAGGASLKQRLGDTIVTNATQLDLLLPENATDKGNGSTYRCPDWYPTTKLFDTVEKSLLFPLDKVATRTKLQSIFDSLKKRNDGNPAWTGLTLDDLLNDAISPLHLSLPRIQPLKDVPVLTADYYYIAEDPATNPYAVVEMDDAIIARETISKGAQFAAVRNISDPVVLKKSTSGKIIPDTVIDDWSGAIYGNFGLYTSFNGALATWSTIAGQGNAEYNPHRDTPAPHADDPIEVKLAYEVRSCGTCSFFWPEKKSSAPYGPYTAYDFPVTTPTADNNPKDPLWVIGQTNSPAFPNPEIIDGCRKAPIMTIGINPNMTAFFPGQMGAAWAYPNFSSANGTDAFAKYAWYYRYRTVYQEKLSFDFIRKYITTEGRVYAQRSGHIIGANRPTESPSYSLTVHYEGDATHTEIFLNSTTGEPPYVVLFDAFPPHNTFNAGDLLAGKLSIPEGIETEIFKEPQTYYTQFAPVLQILEDKLKDNGAIGVDLQIGEDVCQLDMVACASPHWNKDFMGGSEASLSTVVDNCVSKNAWAVKQLVQTRPAVLYVVSESSWQMLYAALGAYLKRDVPLSKHPIDGDFTLLAETTDPNHPAYLEFDVNIDHQRYHHKVRIVISPHFSYSSNFVPQFRIPPATWDKVKQQSPQFIDDMHAHGFSLEPPFKGSPANAYIQLNVDSNTPTVSLNWLHETYPAVASVLDPLFVDAREKMGSVLTGMLDSHQLAWTQPQGHKPGFLTRNEGSCQFCINRNWQFPNECRYEKNRETPPPPGFLEKVAARMIACGKPA